MSFHSVLIATWELLCVLHRGSIKKLMNTFFCYAFITLGWDDCNWPLLFLHKSTDCPEYAVAEVLIWIPQKQQSRFNNTILHHGPFLYQLIVPSSVVFSMELKYFFYLAAFYVLSTCRVISLVYVSKGSCNKTCVTKAWMFGCL